MDGKDEKNKDDDRAGLIHQIASPLAETLPRPDRLESVRDRIRMEGYRAPRVQGSLAERMAFLNGIDFAVFCINQELSNPVETVSPPLSEASRSVPSAAPKIVFCYGADAAIAALKDHSTVLHEGETTPGCTGRSAAPK